MSHDQLVAAAPKRALRTLLVCTFVGLTLAACGGEKTDSASSQVEKTDSVSSQVEKDAPPITAEVVYSFFIDDPLTRFAVKFTNPGEKARSGVTATWKAYDKDGVIVGTHDTIVPPILAGGSTFYAGGAGGANLTGTPAKVTVNVTDNGHEVDTKPASGVTVGSTEFKKLDYSLYEGTTSYEASMVLTATRKISSSDVETALLLRDSNGKVVGAEWADLDSVPDTIAAGEKFKVTAHIIVRDGPPKSVEGYAWE
jgi:hypothetical protein